MVSYRGVLIAWLVTLSVFSSAAPALASFWDGLGTVLGVGATAASGGILGLFGSAVGAWFQLKQRREDREFEKAKWAHEDKLLQLQMQSRVQESEHELKIAAQQGSWKGLEASYISERAGIESNYRWVNAVRSLFRPVLTLALVGVDVYLWLTLIDGLRGGDSTVVHIIGFQSAIDMMTYMVYSHVFACTTAITWWFGDRAFRPKAFRDV